MLSREFQDLKDDRLLKRGNKILSDLFGKSIHSIRQVCMNDTDAKGFYRFLQNDRVSENDIIRNMASTCRACCAGKYVVCIQDTSEINLSNHINRIKRDDFIGTTNAKGDLGLGFLIHPSLVLDAYNGTPYGYADVKVWNRPAIFKSKFERDYNKLPIQEKESYKWIEVSNNTKSNLSDVVAGMVIIQDREGDIYEQFATIPCSNVDLLIRARTNRTLPNKEKLFSCLNDAPSQGNYELEVEGKGGRRKRKATIEIRFQKVEIKKTDGTSKGVKPCTELYFIEAKECDYNGKDKIHWRLLTSIPVENFEVARMCIEWYSWRWTIEEVFKILKKEGYNIEASELEYASSVRKLTLMIMEVVIKLFLMRLAYAEPEAEIEAFSCFNEDEQEFLEKQITYFEGKTEKQKNPFKERDLKRYVWVIARMGGWKGYEWKRHPGITTIWIGYKYFKAAMQGWQINRDVSTR
jgi:Transposase DNA-binding/Transposase DDE domain